MTTFRIYPFYVAPRRTKRGVAALLILATVTSALVAGGAASLAQTAAECRKAGEPTPENFGPTDISAASGNRRLSVGFNDDATVTVLKWPSPSFYDQIKYRTVDRSRPFLGALPNEGAFLGLAWRDLPTEPWEFDWLRDWSSTQRFADDDGDEVVTTFRKPGQGLTVVVRDVVAHDADALFRRVSVRRRDTSGVRSARLISFANFNPVFSKSAQNPYQDWCSEERNDGGGIFDELSQAVVYSRSGIDESTGSGSSVALGMGFIDDADGFQVGIDNYATGGPGTSAYDDAQDGELAGAAFAAGQSDAAIADDLDLSGGRDASTVVIVADPDADAIATRLDDARSRQADPFTAKERWWRGWLKVSALPRNAPRSVTRLAKRALISIRQAADPGGLIVASIATQSPQGLDWIRNGAYINRALDLSGHRGMVTTHNLRYAELQATSVSKPPGGEATPPGNWAMNYYADGVVGGTIPYEIDETGLGIWTLWDHYLVTKDRNYFLSVYEAIQRAAQYLTDVCRDPSTGLQCAASEGDSTNPTRTLEGAQAVWLGLDSAARAARAKARLQEQGRDVALANAEKWTDRRDELAAAIRDNFFDADCTCYSIDHEIGGTLLWPVGFIDPGTPRSRGQVEANFKAVGPAFAGTDEVGRYESKTLLGNAFYAATHADRRRLERGLRWVASVPTTDGTGLLGEAWMVYPPGEGRVTTMVSQPQVWNQAIFYLAALRTYGRARWSDR